MLRPDARSAPPAMTQSPVTVGGPAVTIEDVIDVAYGRRRVALNGDTAFVLRIERGAAFLDEYLDAGGIVSFSTQQGALQFDVNLEAADKAHLKISSRLLTLARHIVNRAEAAKS